MLLNSFYPDILTVTLYKSFMLSQFVVLYKLSSSQRAIEKVWEENVISTLIL